MKGQPDRQVLAFKNPNKEWVIEQLDKLLEEWQGWQKEVDRIEDHPYDKNTHTEIWADGAENIKKHRILQEKTMVFLENNLDGHGFIYGRDGDQIDRTDLRLKIRVQHRIDSLDELRACLPYANIPDAYWLARGKELVDKVVKLAPGKAAELAARYLKGAD